MTIEELLESVDKEWEKENGYVLSLCEPHYFATLVAQSVFEATKKQCADNADAEYNYESIISSNDETGYSGLEVYVNKDSILNVNFEDLNL